MFYVVDENNNRIEAFDKEGVLAAINEAAANGSLESLVADAAFISKIKCCVDGGTFNFAFVTQAKYNELKASGNLKPNGYYIITDDTSAEDINKAFETITQTINEHTDILNNLSKVYACKVIRYGKTYFDEKVMKGDSLIDYCNAVLKKFGNYGSIAFTSLTVTDKIKLHDLSGNSLIAVGGNFNISTNYIPFSKGFIHYVSYTAVNESTGWEENYENMVITEDNEVFYIIDSECWEVV